MTEAFPDEKGYKRLFWKCNRLLFDKEQYVIFP